MHWTKWMYGFTALCVYIAWLDSFDHIGAMLLGIVWLVLYTEGR